MATYSFGTASVSGKADWLIQSCTKSNEAQEATALDNSGEPKAIHYYQKINNVTIEAIIPSDESSIPEIGDVFTYNSVRYYVSAVSITESNTDFVKYSLTCKRFTTAALPANA